MNRPFAQPGPALALAALIAFGAVAPAAAPAQSGQPNAACTQALAYEKSAANDSVTRQAAYDSAVAGLAANQRCADPQMKLVNEAYLLSMRAPAEHDLHIGNWQRDLTRANMLLTQCANWPGIRGTRAATDCTTQRSYNELIAKKLSSQPTPRPATPAPASASPAPAGSPRPPSVPLPTPPSPNRPPR